nr:hypothetical protein [Bacteroidota bacterium]
MAKEILAIGHQDTAISPVPEEVERILIIVDNGCDKHGFGLLKVIEGFLQQGISGGTPLGMLSTTEHCDAIVNFFNLPPG